MVWILFGWIPVDLFGVIGWGLFGSALRFRDYAVVSEYLSSIIREE